MCVTTHTLRPYQAMSTATTENCSLVAYICYWCLPLVPGAFLIRIFVVHLDSIFQLSLLCVVQGCGKSERDSLKAPKCSCLLFCVVAVRLKYPLSRRIFVASKLALAKSRCVSLQVWYYSCVRTNERLYNILPCSACLLNHI